MRKRSQQKQRVEKLLEFVSKTEWIERLHLIGNFETLKCRFKHQKFVFHGVIYNEQEKDRIISQCGFGLSLGSLGLFVIDCLSRNRPILGLQNKSDLIEHAPEASLMKLFPSSVFCKDEEELEVKLMELNLDEIDYQKVYKENISFSDIKQTYLSALSGHKKD